MFRRPFAKNLVLVANAILGLAIPALSFASARAGDEPVNWAREYVQARVQERNGQVLGGAAAAAPAETAAPRIVGGSLAGPDSNPFQVGLLLKAQPDNFLAQYCAGTLIRKRFVVTAAHCSDFVSSGEVQVLTGTQLLDGSGQRRDVASITIHPDWNASTFDNDIAVWELTSSVTDQPTAKLARKDPAVGTKLLATGWGNTEVSGFPIASMAVRVPLVSRATCNGPASYDGAITDNMLCAGLAEGGADTCQGDSGGPLTRKRNGKYKILVGITSWGAGCADPNYYGVYTRVSKYRDFIDSAVR